MSACVIFFALWLSVRGYIWASIFNSSSVVSAIAFSTDISASLAVIRFKTAGSAGYCKHLLHLKPETVSKSHLRFLFCLFVWFLAMYIVTCSSVTVKSTLCILSLFSKPQINSLCFIWYFLAVLDCGADSRPLTRCSSGPLSAESDVFRKVGSKNLLTQ